MVIGGLIYFYVFRQRDLITHPAAYWTLVGCTVVFSLLCSLLESALMTIHLPQYLTQFENRTKQLASQYALHPNATPSAEYIEARHALDEEMLLVSKASERNAPIVVLNHLSTVMLGAVLPISLNTQIKHDVSVDVCVDFPLFGYAPCPCKLLGTGTESLTFFTVSLLLIIFGKIVPEKIGRKRNVWIIRNFRSLIEWVSALVGWLVKPMLAIGDLFLLIF